MNRKPSFFSAAALLCTIAVRAGAAEPGFYVTASVGLADEDPESIGTNVGNSEGIFHVDADQVDVDEGQLAWSVGLGYRLNRYLAAELEYVDFGTTKIVEHYSVDNNFGPIPFPTVFILDSSSNVTGPAVSLLGTLPVGENFELFLRGGALFGSREIEMGFGGLHQKLAETVWLAGAGVTWSFAQRWAVRAEYQQTGKFDESFVAGETAVQRTSLSVLFKL
jgi:hypothetical protein